MLVMTPAPEYQAHAASDHVDQWLHHGCRGCRQQLYGVIGALSDLVLRGHGYLGGGD